MPGLFYAIRLSSPQGFQARLQYPSKHPFPTPIDSYVRFLDPYSLLVEAGVEDAEVPELIFIAGYDDHHVTGDLYMHVGPKDGSDDPEINTEHAETLVEALKKEGWQECAWV